MSNIEEFIKLVNENPGVEIIPLVGWDVVGDDTYNYWLGSWGRCELTEYYLGNEGVHLKSENDKEGTLSDLDGCKYYEDFDGRDLMELTDEQWDELYEGLPWKKAIVVYITDRIG